MKKHLWLFVVALFFVHSVWAQMVVVSSNPADGAVNVDTSTTLSFTFSEPIDTTVVNAEQGVPVTFMIVSPKDSTILQGVSYSQDLKTINLQVTLTPNTDFVIVISYAKSTNGNVLEHPYAVNFTTAAAHGQYSVSGNIMSDKGSVEDVFVILTTTSVFEGDGDVDNAVVSGTVVATSNKTSKLFRVQDTSGYQLNYVRPGTYWLAAAKDVDKDGFIDPENGDWLGFYDADGDGKEDSIVVSNQNVSGIDISLFSFDRYTIKQLIDSVKQLAIDYRQDSVRLIYAQGNTDSLVDGRDFGFYYVFHTPGYSNLLGIYYGNFWVEIEDTVTWVPVDTTAPEIPKTIIDSDSAMAIAEANGGTTFRQRYVNFWISYSVGNQKPFLRQAQVSDTTKIIWVVYYEGFNANLDVYATHTVIIDAETGAVLSAVTGIQDKELENPIPQAFELKQNYPNPFNPATTIEFTLPKAMEVQLAVFDALGRKVATLVNGQLEAGTHQVNFDASSLAAGIYFYSLKAGTMIKTRKMLLVK